MVGSAIAKCLEREGRYEVIRGSRHQLDLVDQSSVRKYIRDIKPDRIVIAAARVGGINANNTYPAEFIYENLMIQANLINAALEEQIERLIFLSSSCIYPKFAEQPIVEDALLTDSLEPTIDHMESLDSWDQNVQKVITDNMGQISSLMPTNLYGPKDNFHLANSHVIPALMYKLHTAKKDDAKSVSVWGSRRALREFLYVDDLANAVVHLMDIDRGSFEAVSERVSHINIGTGIETSIKGLVDILVQTVSYNGEYI